MNTQRLITAFLMALAAMAYFTIIGLGIYMVVHFTLKFW